MKSHAFCLLVFWSLCQLCFSQAKVYSLDELLHRAHERNYQIQKDQLDVQSDEELKKSLFTQYFPHISLGGTYLETANGIECSELVSVLMRAMMETEDTKNARILKRGVLAGISATQPIYMGGLISSANRLADVKTQVTIGQSKMHETEVEQEVEKYYWLLVQCYESKAVLCTMDSLIDYATHDANLALKAGLITQNDVLQIDIYRNQLTSVRLTLDNGIDLSRTYLAHLVGEDRIDSVRWNNIFDVREPGELLVDHTTALELRNETSLLDLQVEAYKLQKRVSLGMNLPKAFATFNYGYHHFYAENDGGFWDKYVGNGSIGWTLMAHVNVPISAWWGGSHSLRRANLQIHKAELDRAEKRSLMSLQMDLKWKELQRAHTQVSVARAQYMQATENERQQSVAYRSGVITMFDRLQAEALLERSFTDYVAACVKYQIAINEYRHVTAR